MEAKHTPGPWEAVGNLVRSPMHQPEGLPTGVQVAECRDGYFLPHTEEAKANARLIAAAPELLGALEGLCSLAELRPGHLQDYKAAVAAARSAIAKATGGAA